MEPAVSEKIVRSVIVGSGHYVPARVVTNEEIAALVGSDAEWIESRTGIKARRFASASETTSGLGLEAAKRALEDAGLEAQQLDALIFATLSPDHAFPGCGVYVQDALGVAGLPALDVRNQCSGYLYALSVADAWIRAGVYRRVLVIGAEVHSAGVDFSERGKAITVLFGDGAGAVILAREEVDDATLGPGIWQVRLGADGKGAQQLWCEAPGSSLRPHIDVQSLAQGRHYPQMNGRAVFRHAVQTLEREVKSLLDDHEIDCASLRFVPHQANQRINEILAKSLGILPEHTIHSIVDYGNTTAASIPMALDLGRKDGRLKAGDMILHAAFGSGFTWGVALLRL